MHQDTYCSFCCEIARTSTTTAPLVERGKMLLSSQDILRLSENEPKVLYLNIAVQDATEAVEEKVKQKLKKSNHIPRSLRAAVASRAAKAASGIASPAVIASMLAEKIPQKMIEKMDEKGITVTVDEVFREGPYVVFQIQVLKVDAVVLMNSKNAKKEASSVLFFEMGSLVGYGLGLIGSNNQQWVEEGYLPKIVQKKLESAMGEILVEKLEAKKMVAETHVLGEAKQARYFFAKYREIQTLKPAGFSIGKRNSNNQGMNLLRRNSSGLTEKESDDSHQIEAT